MRPIINATSKPRTGLSQTIVVFPSSPSRADRGMTVHEIRSELKVSMRSQRPMSNDLTLLERRVEPSQDFGLSSLYTLARDNFWTFRKLMHPSLLDSWWHLEALQ
jgi:hypothetical protein